ncbi:MAG: rod shape-determining protein RodA [Sphingobacteriales bacterium]|nr:MAG: rod shape-determining protein RodA [Sphingobacteriales bacterium]TAF80975.1 MAG: rod shape-determining protein RodA [Sphingobacteriales bacterium]
MINQRSFFFNVDWLSILLFLFLITIGWFSIYAAVYDENAVYIIDFSSNSGKQLLFIMVSIMLGVVILLLDSKFFYVLSPVFYGLTIMLLVAVLLIGRNVGGNQAWIPIGSFRLQPSEFAKWASSLLLARYISSLTGKLNDFSNALPAIVILIFPMLLIMLQPDTGSALVFLALVFTLYREGLSPYFLVAGFMMIILFVCTLLFTKLVVIIVISFVSAFIIYYFYKKNKRIVATTIATFILSVVFIFSVDFVYNNVLQAHQKSRIDLLLGLINDPKGAGYNVNQSKIAIGSGGLLGRGYLQGTQTKFNFVPEQSTDFIFCTIGEEWGFAGTSTVISLYLFLILRLIFIAERQRSSFSRIYGYTVACIIFCHFFINIGMTIGLVPVIGIPLPFISYGGSSLISFTILLFILLKLDANRMGII